MIDASDVQRLQSRKESQLHALHKQSTSKHVVLLVNAVR